MKFTKIAAVIALGAMLMTGCSNSKTAIKAGDVKVSKGDIAFLTDNYYSQMGDYDKAKEYASESYEKAALISAVAKAKGIELSEEDEKAYKSNIAGVKSNYGGVSAFKEALKGFGASELAVELIIKQTYLETALQEEFAAEDPSDDDLKAYMKENYRRAKHVLITVGEDVATGDYEKSVADEILKKAQAGEDFDKLIEEKSQDPGSSSNPDGYVFTDGQMVPEFEEGVDSIKPGEFTIVKSDYGYHVIQRLALDESDAKFNDLFEANKASVLSEYKTKKFDEAVEKFAEENGITVEKNEDVIAELTEPTPEPTEEPTDAPEETPVATAASK